MEHPEQSLALQCAKHAYSAFSHYNQQFREITRRARKRFERCDWAGSQSDQVTRIELYQTSIDRTVQDLEQLAGNSAQNADFWVEIKHAFQEIIARDIDQEFTKTYFNSLTRKFFNTTGVNPEIEFVALDLQPVSEITKKVPRNIYSAGDLKLAAREILMDFAFAVPYQDAHYAIDYLSGHIEQRLQSLGWQDSVEKIELIRSVFYQSKRAYLVGRTVTGRGVLPLVIALRNYNGIGIDAVLQTADEVSILFGFSRTYMHVDLETVGDVVAYLSSILPRKPISELFTVLGRAKQGKTERYRSFFRHLSESEDRFVHAAGAKGMVMIVFTLPSYDVVFKVIRDKFAQPKTMVKQEVMDKYQLVFKHDRAGRLVDAQEFKMLEFHVDRFEPEVRRELETEAGDSIEISGDRLILKHCYVERRLVPLNLYLRQSDPQAARQAVIDYGQAIRDLARTNIFPGDLLLKNFGVTRHKRVIFYDYDELCLLDECNFRDLPVASSYEEEMQSDAWFYVDDRDVFPEQFIQFLGFRGELLDAFLEHHKEILTADYWRHLQRRIGNGEVLEVLPYYRRHRAETGP